MIDRTKAPEDSEVSVVGSMMIEPTCIGEVSEIIRAEDYTDAELGTIHGVIIGLWADGSAIEASLVAAKSPPHLRGLVYQCANATGTAVAVGMHATMIRDAATRRSLVGECKAIERIAKNDDRLTAEVVADAQGRILGVTGHKEQQPFADVLDEVEGAAQAASRSKSLVVGVPSGFKKLDILTGGFMPGDMWVIAARPSVGKTSAGQDIALYNLFHTEYNTVFFSAEMNRRMMAMRFVSTVAGVDSMKIRTGQRTEFEVAACEDAARKIKEAVEGRFLLDDKSSPTPSYMVSRVLQLRNRQAVDLVIIDQFSQIKADGNFSASLQEYEARAGQVKEMAMRLDVPVLMLHQLRRSAEGQREMKVPILTDVKSTGKIEEDADGVILLHRKMRDSEYGDWYLAKQRSGDTGHVGSFRYDGPTTKWTEA